MLQAGRVPPTWTKPLDDQSPSSVSPDLATRRLVDVTTSRLDVGSTRSRDAESSSGSGDLAPSELVVKSPTVALTYQRQTVFLTPDLRGWLKKTAKDMPVEGLSASDVVRLALNELRRQVGEGSVDLVAALTAQAHREAATMAGRRNRGLPPPP